MKNRQIQIRANATEILFLRQALQARRVQAALDESPEDKIRRLERDNYWLRRLRDEQAAN